MQVAVQRTVDRPAHAPQAGRVIGRVVGVDAGIKHLAVLSTGELVANPAPFKAALKKLGQAQRRAARRIGPYDPATRSKRTASNRWRRAQATVARLHAAVSPRPRRLVAPTHHPPGAAVHHGRGRGPARGRHGP